MACGSKIGAIVGNPLIKIVHAKIPKQTLVETSQKQFVIYFSQKAQQPN